MLNIVSVSNSSENVYIVPQNRESFVYIDIWPLSATDLTVLVNGVVYFHSDNLTGELSLKLSLTENDTVTVTTTGTVNVFVHGIEKPVA